MIEKEKQEKFETSIRYKTREYGKAVMEFHNTIKKPENSNLILNTDQSNRNQNTINSNLNSPRIKNNPYYYDFESENTNLFKEMEFIEALQKKREYYAHKVKHIKESLK